MVVLPTIPFGVNTGQLDVTLDINMMPSTQAAVLYDVVHALANQGIPKLVVLNGHGGNNFKQMIREIGVQFPDVFLCMFNWYHILDNSAYFDEPGDHAGEMETSVMMHVVPDLVRPLSEAGTGATRPFTVAGLREGWVWAERDWLKATVDTGVGNPARSTADKGERFLNALTQKVAGFLVDLAACDVDDLYA